MRTIFLIIVALCSLFVVVQSKSEQYPSLAERRTLIKEAFQLGWHGYMKYAKGHDDLLPLSHGYHDWLQLGATIVDSLDTIIIMGLQDEYKQAVDWIAQNLTFQNDVKISVFETTIRILGGLCSAHSLTNDSFFITKAKQLAEKLMPAFDTPTGISFMDINLKTGEADSQRLDGYSSLAAIGSLQMEFLYLAKQVNDSSFANKALKVIKIINNTNFVDGLPPLMVDPLTAKFQGSTYTLGPRADSFYEYLIKMFVLTNHKVPIFKNLFDQMMTVVSNRLLRYSSPNHFTYLGSEAGGVFYSDFPELTCFAGGMFILASRNERENEKRGDYYLSVGRNLTITCNEMMKRQATHISPESVTFDGSSNDFYVNNPSYLLRPETVESLFYLHRTTSNEMYRDWGWKAFLGIDKFCRTEDGWSGLRDVTTTDGQQDDYQQSFFLAETLKYLFLLNSDSSVVDLNQFVFNTEAHPLKIFDDEFQSWQHLVQSVL